MFPELLGQNVKVLVKHDNNGNYDKAYGVYADEDSKILATGFVSGLETDGDKIKLDGTSYKFDNGYSLDATLVYDVNKDTNAVSLRPWLMQLTRLLLPRPLLLLRSS